jgi:hypothetical protein
MPNPAQPIEKRVKLGNPGRRPLPSPVEIPTLTAGYVEPLRPLGEAGASLWAQVFDKGGLWVSGRTDAHLLQITCEQLDRRDMILAAYDPADRSLNMTLMEIEKTITANLGLLGFTPADRSKLGFTLAKTESKLQKLLRADDN